jgi:hypothetical protein
VRLQEGSGKLPETSGKLQEASCLFDVCMYGNMYVRCLCVCMHA